ncbi:DNA oxidative demethylase AlkB [Acetobacter indonesiensis]|uniref:DNA oxidative demethylase AlkB n=1 Tax=Acetobacter indonesiensis TaxID=104101 RepID=UPI0020A605D5|nr:DNA oxidative demethylase AlkB [Acetobacter indonesiensis]MCP1231891.1 DNA oxidative demethylase AlkB [Acetobacter indonesiensis]
MRPSPPPLFPQMELGLTDTRPSRVTLSPGAVLLRGFALPESTELFDAILRLTALSPFRTMQTPGGGRMSVAMSNCGPLGWVTDRSGYRYTPTDPVTLLAWPDMPPAWHALAARAAKVAGFDNFSPNACLINRYEPHTRMALHQDKDEGDFSQPIVSVSLGLPIVFLWGGLKRSTAPHSILLEHGDVLVWGGKARLHYHGVKHLADGIHPLTDRARFNLTFRFVAPRS